MKDTLIALRDEQTRLRQFTKDCRLDMHEPCEQEIWASVWGRIFDNAIGTDQESKELVVELIHMSNHSIYRINLATLIAIARAGEIS